MAGIATDATGISSLQSGLETPDVALNLRKQGDSIVSGVCCCGGVCAGPHNSGDGAYVLVCILLCRKLMQ